ncbi:MBL fold metallo-hydrolase [Halocalculus aciditolerans]|uniref:MBL fold hydrolase n=1 Tax=Halocalculus aciditolerans TaxID=1383812 RepID=A0A830FP31_9EURY|nr:MBL fold metallo-hydrolase [Halocalculus aciditolerans]GGL72339.1 MBL fold hydrolase [Halocalculus aciditolerans]
MIDSFALPVDAAAPGGETNGALVGDTLLVDPAARTPELDDAVAAADVEHLALTHTHPDHVAGVAHYAATTDATVWCRYGREDRFEDSTGVEPDETFREGDRVGPATVLETPGHAPDHVAFRVDGEIVSGDLVFRDTSTYVGSRDGDMRAYLASLRHLRAAEPGTLYPGHGPRIENPMERIAELLAHRRYRERQVETAVHGGARTASEVVDAAYDRNLGDARPLAVEAVRAHLEKLAVEKRVAWDGDRAEPR